MAKIIRLNEQDIERMVKRVLKEGLSTDELKFNTQTAVENFNNEVKGNYIIITPPGKDKPETILAYSTPQNTPFIKQKILAMREMEEYSNNDIYFGTIKWNSKLNDKELSFIAYQRGNKELYTLNEMGDETEEDDFEWIRTSLEGRIRDVYDDTELQGEAWEFSERYFPKGAFAGLIGVDEDDNDVTLQGIDNMLNMVEDLGSFSRDEWKLFFAKVREWGI